MKAGPHPEAFNNRLPLGLLHLVHRQTYLDTNRNEKTDCERKLRRSES